MIFHSTSSGNLLLKPTISVLGTPSVTVWKTSPSLPPCFHSQSNKFGHRPPLCAPSVAWQYPAQVASKIALPNVIASALPAKGFFRELSTGVSALARAPARTTRQRATLRVQKARLYCIVFPVTYPPSPQFLHLGQAIGGVKRAVKGNTVPRQQGLERTGRAKPSQS